MANAVIYARYSSHNQREESIEDQIRVCREVAERAGDRIVHIYHDSAKSGTEVSHRLEFLRMIEDAKRRKWSKVYVWKLDRFSRDKYDMAVYRHKLSAEGVSLVSATEPMIEGPESVILESLLEGMAQYYSLKLSVEIKRGLVGNALKAHHNGVKVYGYDLEPDGTYSVNEAEAAVVLDAFKRYADGESVNDIADDLNEAGVRNKRGHLWSVQQVAKLLRNAKYKGVYKFGEQVVEDGMPVIVESELFDRVNASLGRRRKRGHYYPLTGKLFDAQGRKLVGTSATGKRGKRYYYYWVPGTARRWPQGDLEDCVYGAVSDFLQRPGVIDRIVEGMLRVQRRREAERPSAITSLRERLGSLERDADNLVDLAMRTGSSDRIAKRLEEVEAEREDVAVQLAEAEARTLVIDESLIRFFLEKIIDCEVPEDIVARFVTRIDLEGDYMTVTFALADDGGDWGDSGGRDSENPSEPAGQEGCSHRYPLVEMSLVDTNPTIIFGPFWFAIVVQI